MKTRPLSRKAIDYLKTKGLDEDDARQLQLAELSPDECYAYTGQRALGIVFPHFTADGQPKLHDGSPVVGIQVVPEAA